MSCTEKHIKEKSPIKFENDIIFIVLCLPFQYPNGNKAESWIYEYGYSFQHASYSR